MTSIVDCELSEKSVEFDKSLDNLNFLQICIEQDMEQLKVNIESSRSALAKLAYARVKG